MCLRTLACLACTLGLLQTARGQNAQIDPQFVTRSNLVGRVTVVEVAPHFVTAIRLPEAVNSVVVGNPGLFQVEHSENEPQLVFIKPLTTAAAQTNVLISTSKGHQVSLLVVTKGEQKPGRVDFLVNYKPERKFMIEADFPSAQIGETVSIGQASIPAVSTNQLEGATPVSLDSHSKPQQSTVASAQMPHRPTLDELLYRQERAPLPALHGGRIDGESTAGERVRAGVGEVIDGGQQVFVLFSIVNPQRRHVLLMPPQVQLGGKSKRGRFIKRTRWTTAEQLPVMDYRLSRRRLGPGERADGVVAFERPPYKQSNETLLLQVAEAGAVDRPTLAPIGFGISSSSQENRNDKSTSGR